MAPSSKNNSTPLFNTMLPDKNSPLEKTTFPPLFLLAASIAF